MAAPSERYAEDRTLGIRPDRQGDAPHKDGRAAPESKTAPPYADAIAVAIAQREDAVILTGDPDVAKVEHLVTVGRF